MATNIGGVSCDFVKGFATGPSESVKTFRRPGLNGNGAKKQAQESGQFNFTGIKFDSNSNVESWQTDIEAKRSTIIDIEDDFGITHSDCLVTEVSPLTKSAVVESGTLKVRAEMSVSGFLVL